MYCSASSETSAACRSSMARTRGLPPAIRVSVRASSSKTCVWFSAPLAPLRAVCAPPLAASRISTISVSIGKSARRSGARSEKSAAAELPESR